MKTVEVPKGQEPLYNHPRGCECVFCTAYYKTTPQPAEAKCAELESEVERLQYADDENETNSGLMKDQAARIEELEAERDALKIKLAEAKKVIETAYKITTEHDERLPFDWAVFFCEMLYQHIAKL